MPQSVRVMYLWFLSTTSTMSDTEPVQEVWTPGNKGRRGLKHTYVLIGFLIESVYVLPRRTRSLQQSETLTRK